MRWYNDGTISHVCLHMRDDIISLDDITGLKVILREKKSVH
jgi:hypothetical protein